MRVSDDHDLARRLSALYAGVLYDALTFDLDVPEPFVLDRAIRRAPLQPDVVLVGMAFTCGGELVQAEGDQDDLFRLRMLSEITPGCIQVVAAGTDRSCAHFGDISGRLAALHGAVGAVLDGNTRDVSRLARDGFPVFCRDVLPVDAFGRWQLVRHQVEEELAGENGAVAVAPQDWIFADSDGVLRIRAGDLRKALRAAEDRQRHEDEIRTRLQSDDPLTLYREVGRW